MEKIEPRQYKLRDAASLMAFIGPIVLAAGVIGSWYLSQYRMEQVESRTRALETALITYREEQIRGSSKLVDIDDRVRWCCPYGKRRYERD